MCLFTGNFDLIFLFMEVVTFLNIKEFGQKYYLVQLAWDEFSSHIIHWNISVWYFKQLTLLITWVLPCTCSYIGENDVYNTECIFCTSIAFIMCHSLWGREVLNWFSTRKAFMCSLVHNLIISDACFWYLISITASYR